MARRRLCALVACWCLCAVVLVGAFAISGGEWVLPSLVGVLESLMWHARIDCWRTTSASCWWHCWHRVLLDTTGCSCKKTHLWTWHSTDTESSIKGKGELSNGRASCRTKGRIVERKASCRKEGMMGCGRGMWHAQPLINNARKMPSAEGVLHALVLEGGKIGKNVFKGSKEWD